MKSRSRLKQTAAKRGIAIEIVRTGSRGLYWLEPMVEVATATRPRRVRSGDRRRRRRPCSMRWSRTARIRCGLASPRKFPG